MSSGFVPGGTIDQPAERDDEWIRAQRELEEARRRKEEESRQDGGKSLYEVLQANKAAKQDAFEESIRLKNQFRNLDEDEVEFLDSVLESTRAHEEAVKKETREQLELFRRQQEEADRALMAQSTTNADATGVGVPGSPTGEESLWTVNARKRKRLKEKEAGKLVKQRKPSLPMETPDSTAAKTSSLQPTAGEGKPSASADRKGHGIEIPARNPLKLAEPRAEVTNTAVTDERPGKLRISTGNPKPSLLNFGLGSYDSDDEE